MTGLLTGVLVAAALLALYTYGGYPLLLWSLSGRSATPAPSPARFEPGRDAHADSPPGEGPPISEGEWPAVSIVVPVYNEARQVAGTIRSLLEVDYPRDRLQILVVSDASTDGTDEIVQGFSRDGVEIHRIPERGGKTAAENAAAHLLRGEIVVNTDASVRLERGAVKRLVGALSDPEVGVASGRDVSVTRVAGSDGDPNLGESGYVGYEMWVRRLESRIGGIVGASGSIYAMRVHLHTPPVPEALSRDFASALTARENGFRSVSVDDAIAYVPRTPSLRREYRRKVRTMARGMQTLAFKRHLLDPRRFGLFSWMLFSHKVCRWLTPWGLLAGLLALAALSLGGGWIAALLGTAVVGIVLGVLGWLWPQEERVPFLLSILGYGVTGNLAAIHATVSALRRNMNPTWEPTRRDSL